MEMADQMRALADLKTMAASYGFDIGRPAANAREAVQWTYFGYLGAIKEMNGAAMSIGRVSTFFDIYIERDLAEGTLTEAEAQELIDQFVIKLRIVRFLRTPAYDALFSGDPYWATESVGGMALDGRTLVTRSSFRVLHTLKNLGPAPEPNLSILWSKNMPDAFKRYCIATSIETSALQYENDDLMLPEFGDDYGIACCVSAMRLGKQMQYFGARVNLAKSLLYAINGGRDEKSGVQVAPAYRAVTGDVLEYDDVMAKFDDMMEWLAQTYVHAMNCIHYAHDHYNYERLMFALHDRDIIRTMAFGIAGLSVAADSLSAIKYAKVKPIRNEDGLVTDYETTGEFPMFGNNDPRVDDIAADLVKRFMDKLRKHPTYRGAIHTQSVLTITSNVVYGKATGNTPDGRREGEPFAPGANPMHGRDSHGWLASCLSVARLPYEEAQDGISYTLSVVPSDNRQGEAEAIDAGRRRDRHVFRAGRIPPELQRPAQGDAAGCDGEPGQVSAAHHSRLGIRGELRPPHARAAARCRQPQLLPRKNLTMPGAGRHRRSRRPSFRKEVATISATTSRRMRRRWRTTAKATAAFGYAHSYETGSSRGRPRHPHHALPLRLPAPSASIATIPTRGG